jgi:hypothetical protein
LITEQVVSHEELVHAVYEASVDYVQADQALTSFRLSLEHFTPENLARLENLKRSTAAKSRVLREAQTQLLLANRE